MHRVTKAGGEYPEELTAPMREELVRMGVKELRTPEAVDDILRQSGTALVVVNSVCGCAARNARPAVAKALQHNKKPDRAVTVFAGVDRDATDRVRMYFTGYKASSPQIALLRDGKLVFMLERAQIEVREADEIADELKRAFDQYCNKRAEAA
jgi:putative YphP/YqiW family bacilliredoxin